LHKDNKIAANEVIPNHFQMPLILSQMSNKSTIGTPRENENNGDKNGRHNQ